LGALFYKDNLYILQDGKFEAISFSEAKKKRVGALLPLAFIIPLTFKLPANLDQEQLDLQIELKMYNEGGLDPNKEYVIDYIAYKLENENSYLVEAFALDQEKVAPHYQESVKKIGFLDYLFPKFIAYKALYDKEFVPKENHLYLSLGEEESFGVIYQEGRYIGYRQIDSLMQMAKKLGYELSYLKSLLAEKGIKEDNYTIQEKHIYDALLELLYKNVEKLVYAINFKRSYFGLDRIDKVFIDFEGQVIEGLRDLFLSFGVEGDYICEPFECCGVDAKSSALAVAIRYVERYEELDQRLNFSFFERKKPLFSYRVVRLSAVAALFLLLLLGGWGYLFVKQQQISADLDALQERLNAQRQQSERYLKAIKELKDRKGALLVQIKELKRQNDLIQDTIDAIPFVEQAKITRQQMMNDIVEALYRYRLSTRSIDQNGTKFADVALISQNNQREKIAKFMEYLLQKGYKEVSTRQILRRKDFYESVVRVVR